MKEWYMENALQVAVLEDLEDVALALAEIINEEEDMSCKQVYHNAEDAMLFLPRNPADVMIVDIGLPRASGIEAILHLSEKCPDMLFCMFTVYEDDDKIFESLKAGAKGYILKKSSDELIVKAIRELHAGGSPMSPSIARRIIDLFSNLPASPVTPDLPLTERELELLEHLSKGYLYKEIAEKMGITVGTVKQHIHKIYDKLHVTNRTEAINKYRGI
jgi:DNA-binding NarL/FixJ family response regulator